MTTCSTDATAGLVSASRGSGRSRRRSVTTSTHRRIWSSTRADPPGGRSSYDEVETLFGYLDDRVETIARSGRKGALAALRDAQMVKTAYAFKHGASASCAPSSTSSIYGRTRGCRPGEPTALSTSATPSPAVAAPRAAAQCSPSLSSTGSLMGCVSGSSSPGRC